jgi:hypothetical protein
MSRIVWCVMVVAVMVTATGCNCFGTSCRRPSFMEFRSPSQGWCGSTPNCGPACAPVCGPACGSECTTCGEETVVFE